MTAYNKMNFRTKKSVGISGFIVHPVIFHLNFLVKIYFKSLFSSFSVVQAWVLPLKLTHIHYIKILNLPIFNLFKTLFFLNQNKILFILENIIF